MNSQVSDGFGEGIGRAIGEGFAQGLGEGIGAAFAIILLFGLIILTGIVLTFLIGIKKRPRTTVLAYGLGLIGHLLGSILEIQSLALLGVLTGAAIGYFLFNDTPFERLQGRTYTLFIRFASAATLLITLAITAQIFGTIGGRAIIFLPFLPLSLIPAVYGLAPRTYLQNRD